MLCLLKETSAKIKWITCHNIGFFKKFYLFLAVLGLHSCVQAFSSCGEWGLLFGARASHYSGFTCCRAQALSLWASVVVARGLSSCGSGTLKHGLSSCGART